MTWPITWPDAANVDGVDPNIKRLCEHYASASMRALTLQRAGGGEITIMPGSRGRVAGYYAGWHLFEDAFPLGVFYPGVYPSAEDLKDAIFVRHLEAIALPGPVGDVTEVKADGVVLDPSAYRVEDGHYLIRVDGKGWPDTQGDGFTVSYINSHPVDEMGAHAGGVMAHEWLKLITGAKGGCRLPPSVTSVSRQGINYTITPGMFPDGVTGIPEIDAYVMLFNPFGLKVPPKVYSLDTPHHRQVTA